MKYSFFDFVKSKTHIIPFQIANKFGIQILRTILSNFIIYLRRIKNCRPKNLIEKRLIDDGIIVIPNFLPEQEFLQLCIEIDKVINDNKDVRIINQGSNKTFEYNFRINEDKNFSVLQKFFKNEQLIRLISVAEGKKNFKEIESFRFEKTIFGDPKNDADNNVLFHADVHFHSHKILFYTSDVSNNDAPFAYCVKSHKNNFKRLFYEFRRGLLKNSHIQSWRIQDNLNIKFFKNYFDDLMKSKLKVVAKKNTLIIANVHGFHQRGSANEGATRSLIRIAYRYNPLGLQKSLAPHEYSGTLF
jgi:hypothetical protein